ncbi:uncharacterized protein raw isoform X3 [Eurosta solidaginis]|uniref:uncharacterized protein raw isoform X3 n=1 Tax=Eurosta solidaginis TaxID=178769 RepID=UPI003530E1A5
MMQSATSKGRENSANSLHGLMPQFQLQKFSAVVVLLFGSALFVAPPCLLSSCTAFVRYRRGAVNDWRSSMPLPTDINQQDIVLKTVNSAVVDCFIKEVLNAWRAKARCNVVPAERTQELFHELSFHPSEKQISEMLQTAKLLARKGSRQSNGLTFGEFCVLAADLKRFRASTFSPSICDKVNLLSSLQAERNGNSRAAGNLTVNTEANNASSCATTTGTELRSTKSLSNVEDCKRKLSKGDTSAPVEVFLGGSCNPTTWRADVAIPALNELGISFYNPQVSEWTPDLIELEFRAKEKARVLFFVMDSETRASAGAIEAAHIAGQNCKQLVMVLLPYKRNQSILNEQISQQEYIDLRRNQLILKELVTRRGLPVLDDIPSGLQRTKDILAGIRDPPSNIATILVVVRGAFDRVNPVNGVITVAQCQRALLYLGYAQSLVKLDNLNKIIASQRETLDTLHKGGRTKSSSQQEAIASGSGSDDTLKSSSSSSCNSDTPTASMAESTDVDFDLFCVISAYLSVLQQEIQESGCISPIKGTNVPPPPVYLTNMQGDDSNFAISYFSSKNISRTSSQTSVPGSDTDRHSGNDLLSRSRDSGTSSPQPLDQPLKSRSGSHFGGGKAKTKILVNIESIETTEITTTTIQTAHTPPTPPNISTTTASAYPSLSATHTTTATTTTTTHPLTQMNANVSAGVGAGATAQMHFSLMGADSVNATATAIEAEESDSNDSVFSSSSSINSVNCNYGIGANETLTFAGVDFRDVYLGGSCYLRSKWRQDIAMPYLKSKGITFHLPALHESLPTTPLDLTDKVHEDPRQLGTHETSLKRTRRKYRGAALEEEEEEELTVSQETYSWALPPMRTNLYNPALLDASRVLLFVITNETRSLAPMTLAAHCIGLMYNVVLAVQMLPDDCVINNEKNLKSDHVLIYYYIGDPDDFFKMVDPKSDTSQAGTTETNQTEIYPPQGSSIVSNVAAVSLPRIPIPTIADNDIEAFFYSLEFWFEASGISGDSRKYSIVLASIPPSKLLSLRAIIDVTPSSSKYDYLKSTLIQRFTDSQPRRLQKVLQEMVLGDQKPSEFFSNMQHVAGTSWSESALLDLWISRLPPTAQPAVIASTADLAAKLRIADAIVEANSLQSTQVSAVSSGTEISSLRDDIAQISAEIQHINKKFENLSSSVRSPTNDSNICWYHRKYGRQATKCRDPCLFAKEKQQARQNIQQQQPNKTNLQ